MTRKPGLDFPAVHPVWVRRPAGSEVEVNVVSMKRFRGRLRIRGCPTRGLSRTTRICLNESTKFSRGLTVDHLRYRSACFGNKSRRAPKTSFCSRATRPPGPRPDRPLACARRGGSVAESQGLSRSGRCVCRKSSRWHPPTGGTDDTRGRISPQAGASIYGQRRGSAGPYRDGDGIPSAGPDPDLGFPALPRSRIAARPSLAVGCRGERSTAAVANSLEKTERVREVIHFTNHGIHDT